MIKPVCYVLCLFLSLEAISIEAASTGDRWLQFKLDFNKTYPNAIEESLRREIFEENLRFIEEFNANPKNSYKLGINHFSDYTPDQIRKLVGLRQPLKLGFDGSHQRVAAKDLLASLANNKFENGPPDSWDWTEHDNVVSDVRQQDECSAGWAFATTGVLEGQQLRLGQKEFIVLSAQNLIDCSTYDRGCDGGDIMTALKFVRDQGGIESDMNYPYVGKKGKDCKFNVTRSVFTDSGSAIAFPCSEQELKELVAAFGPIAVGISATNRKFQSYTGGVLDLITCGGELTHHMLLVGYGTDKASGKDFWKLKNSWGTTWGEKGYLRLVRNQGRDCGITQEVVTPIFIHS